MHTEQKDTGNLVEPGPGFGTCRLFNERKERAALVNS
jgi:hypothetical protein